MPIEIPFEAPGDHYRGQWLDFLPDLIRHFSRQTSYPITRIFALLPIAPSTHDVYEALTARGAFDIDRRYAVNDVEGGDFEADFADARFGIVRISFPVTVKAEWSRIASGSGLRLDFSPSPLNTWIEHLPDGIGVSKFLTLRKMEFRTESWIIWLQDQNAPHNTLILTVALGRDYFDASLSDKVRKLGESLSSEEKCNGGGSGEDGYWVKWSTSGCAVYAAQGMMQCVQGPFDTYEEAEAWIEQHCDNHVCDPDQYSCDNNEGRDTPKVSGCLLPIYDDPKGGCC